MHRSFRVPTTIATGIVLVVALGTVAFLIGTEERHEPSKGTPRHESATVTVIDRVPEGEPVAGPAVTSVPFLAALPTDGRTAHTIRIDALAAEIQLDADTRYTAWTFGGTVPGPVVHVRRGDRVHWTTANRTDELVPVIDRFRATPDASPFARQVGLLDAQTARTAIAPIPIAAGIDAVVGPPDQLRVAVSPGQTVEYAWTAEHAGIFPLRSSMPNRLMQHGMGLFGLIVVSPEAGFPTDGDVARTFVVIRTEHYLSPVGTDGRSSWDHAAAVEGRPTLVTLNGTGTGMHERPLVADRGERIRLYVVNGGPVYAATFSIVGIVFDRAWHGGVPQNELRSLATLRIEPGTGTIAEFVAPEPGLYTILFERSIDAEPTATGTLTVGEVRQQ